MSKKKKAGSGKAGNKKADKKQKVKAVKVAGKKSAKGGSAKKTSKQSSSGKSGAKKPLKGGKAAKALKPKASKNTSVKKPSKPVKKSDKGASKKVLAKAKPLAKKSKAPATKPTSVKKPAPVKKSVTIVKKGKEQVKTAKPVAKVAQKASVANTLAPKPQAKAAVAAAPKPSPAPPLEKVKKAEETASSKKAELDKKTADVLAITNTIPVAQKNEISPSKIASISHSITNPIRKTDSYAVKAEKEPNGKFEMEFVVHCSAEMLYEFLSTPSGLSEWFCDDLNIRNGIYTFIWEDQMQQARLLKTIELQVVRFQWVDKTDGSYFEFRIQRDDLTNDISLIITDFAETVSERESAKLLWHSQIEKLMHVIGSIF